MITPAPTFESLGVPRELVAVLGRQGIVAPFEVQAATIPDALAGRDVLGRAPTGSGKTLAFGLPLLARLGRGERRRPRGLILSPTRELAEQIRRDLHPLALAAGRTIAAVYGGTGFRDQVSALRRGTDVLVACPGRLQDLIEQGEVTLDRVDRVVVDEADRMADMGFLPAVRQLLDRTADDRQTVMFSATLDREVQVLTDRYQRDPVTHHVGEVEPDLSSVTHRFILAGRQAKVELAADLIEDCGPTMVFCRTRHGVDRVARQLKRAGVKAGWMHGGRSQSQRDAALDAFAAGRVRALVATDVAARGIHVDGVSCVIHFDPPADRKDYVHRSGRTARAGAGGVVISVVHDDQRTAVTRLQREVGLPTGGFEPQPELRPRDLPAHEVAGSGRSGGAQQPAARPSGQPGRQRSGPPSPRSRRRRPASADSRQPAAPAGGARRESGGDAGGGRRSQPAAAGGARRETGGGAGGGRRSQPAAAAGGARREGGGGAGGGRRSQPAGGGGSTSLQRSAGGATRTAGKKVKAGAAKRSGRPRPKSKRRSDR
jgi:superfamily II DNA/RNA helicase